MEINQHYSSPSAMTLKSMRPLSTETPPPRPEPVEGELSGYLADTEKSSEIRDFMHGLKDMSLSGEFDAAMLAEQAPESLKLYAEAQGVELEDMLQLAHDKFSEMKPEAGSIGRGTPPPPVEGELSGFLAENRDEEAVQVFMDSLKEMSKSGNFDAASLAEQAPEVLQTYAQTHGVELEDILQNAHEHAQELKANREEMRAGSNLSEAYGRQDSLGLYAQVAQLGTNESSMLNTLMATLKVEDAA